MNTEQIYKAWQAVGADIAGLKWEDFVKNLPEQPAQPQQEPVAVIGSNFQLLWCREDWSKGLRVGDFLYTSPPAQRKPLTDEQIQNIWSNGDCFEEIAFARAIEAAHGIKENT